MSVLIAEDATGGVATYGSEDDLFSLYYVFPDGASQQEDVADINDTIESLADVMVDNNGVQRWIAGVDVNSAGFIVHIVSDDLATAEMKADTLVYWAAYVVTQFNSVYVQPAIEAAEETGVSIWNYFMYLVAAIIAYFVIRTFLDLSK